MLNAARFNFWAVGTYRRFASLYCTVPNWYSYQPYQWSSYYSVDESQYQSSMTQASYPTWPVPIHNPMPSSQVVGSNYSVDESQDQSSMTQGGYATWSVQTQDPMPSPQVVDSNCSVDESPDQSSMTQGNHATWSVQTQDQMEEVD